MVMRVVLVDDHEVFRVGLRAVLARAPGVEVCGEASTGRQAVELAAALKPDVVIMDISMPDLNGIEATRQLLQASPQTQVLILSLHESDQVVQDVLSAGARGYLLKSDAATELLTALDHLKRRSLYFSTRISETVLGVYAKGMRPDSASATVTRLSKREREIVQLLAEGKANKQVAAILKVSVKTVETHRSNLMAKLNLHSMSDLVRYAVRNGIVQP